MELDAEATIIAKLQLATDFSGIHSLIAAHLHPFTPFFKPSATAVKKSAKISKSKSPDEPPSIRPLAKQFLSFIHKSLSLLPKRLTGSPPISLYSAVELFDSYRLTLDCLDLIAPELAGKPHSVQVQRIRYVHCLEHWDMYKEAETEGFVVLESLRETVGGSKGNPRKAKARLVPDLNKDIVDKEVAAIILEIVVTLVKCASKRRSEEDAYYWRVISLVNESEPWFKILDAKEYEKFHRFLETNLHIIALFLVAEIKSFGIDLVQEFTLVSFQEYKKSRNHDQMKKVALKICSSLFSQRDELSTSVILDVLKHTLDIMAAECKVGEEKSTLGFLELVCYCANKCHSVPAICDPVAEHLSRLVGRFRKDFPFISSIMRLYASGLLVSPSNNQSKEGSDNCNKAPLGSALQIQLNNHKWLQEVATSTNLLNDHLGIGSNEKNCYHIGISHSPYWEAFKFFCQSLAESIYSNRKDFFSDTESHLDDLSSVHNALHQFCYIFLQCLSSTERDDETSGESHRVISVVVVAALMLSLKTNKNIKESTWLVKNIILAEGVPVKRLKYLYVSLNNIAVILNRKKRLKEATKVLKLCCRAAWYYVVDLCKMYVNKSLAFHDGMSEKDIADFVIEASGKIAYLLELNQDGYHKINEIINESLKCWSISENLIATLPTPVSFVKEWVKIQYSLSREADSEDGIMLYSLLSSSKEISKKSLGKLLEEELLAYDEKSYLNLGYGLRMQMKIIDFLLEEVYVTKDCDIMKSKTLLAKGKVLRAHGLARLDECIQCLSEAISMLTFICGTKKSCGSQVHLLLVHAYILHALFTQEASPSSLVLSPNSGFLRDVNSALNLWLSPDQDHAGEQYEDMLYLWYQLIDFLSIKGYLEIHPSLYDVVIKLFNGKNFSFVKTVSELWRSKRLSHVLCASPVNHIFVKIFSKHQRRVCSSAEFWRLFKEELKPLVVGFHQNNNEIKKAASGLISNVPLSSCSVFLSSNLYYDLSESLISSGRITEALTYAKEAHRLRSKLLQQKFEYSVEKKIETFQENGVIVEKSHFCISTFRLSDTIVMKGSCNNEGYMLTPWNVLSCYLESLLQVGCVHEILGNVTEADMLLRWGRNVSQYQGLPLFDVSFSLMLGKLYKKQKLWSMAEKEFFSAKKTLDDNLGIVSCKKCICMLETSINQQIGDFFMCSSCSTGEMPFAKKLLSAKQFYKLALDNLNLTDWRSSYSNFEEAKVEQVISREISETKIEPRRSRRTNKELKPASQKQQMVGGLNRRITRSTHQPLAETCELVSTERKTSPAADLVTEHLSTSSVGSDHGARTPELGCSAADFKSDISSLCKKFKCWHCLHIEAVECSNLNDFIYTKWERVYRKLCLRLLISIGKFSGICGNVHEAHEILLQSVSILFSRNSNCSKYCSDSLVALIESIGKHFPGDTMAVERATLLYYICWFTLKSYANQRNRKFCCDLSRIGIMKIISLLKLSFTLCREIPLLFQKISRLLAAVYVLSTSLKQWSISPHDEGSESLLASFFHQASVGTPINQQIVSSIMQRRVTQVAGNSEDSSILYSESTFPDISCSLRSAPESSEDLEEFVQKFFEVMPSTPVICISIVAGADGTLISELLRCSPTVRAWILLSHLSSDNQHVILLPVYKTLEDDDASSSTVIVNCKDCVKQWQCPWISSVIDDIAPVFRNVLEGNYYSSSDYFLECIKESTSLWWAQRNKLDLCLSKFLQDMEDMWLGPWKHMLLGEWLQCNYLDSTQKNLSQDERHLLELAVTKKCYVSLRCEASPKSSEFDNIVQLLFRRELEVSDDLDRAEYNRNPIILVLDFDVQMLPWESLPILRNQEVYRMPSISSIFATLDRCQQQFETSSSAFPLIDPLDSYYLLNPDGDLSRTQVEFESWFKDQNIEGKIGTVPTIDELSLALKTHDLFIYFGHGSGTQYIPGHEIQKLDTCAATLLLGCSSGSLYLKGCYLPQGAPISYILAGSPVIVANLWEVTDKDIDRFGKAMLNAWVIERSLAHSAECTLCNVALKSSEFRNCEHRPRIGSFMGQARDACHLGYLIGAAPVCYGVPTGIIKRKDA